LTRLANGLDTNYFHWAQVSTHVKPPSLPAEDTFELTPQSNEGKQCYFY
jgi:hypothetical protein